MSVTTQADRLRGEAADLAKSLVKTLAELTLGEPWGWEDLTLEARDEYTEHLRTALKLRTALRCPYEGQGKEQT